MRKTLTPTVARVLKRLHYPLDVILTCVRWYVAYPLSLRHLEEMMSERGIEVDHSTVHRWAMKLLPVFEKAFRRHKRMVGKSWRMDETYIKVKGQWKYLYRALDKDGNTIDFLVVSNLLCKRRFWFGVEVFRSRGGCANVGSVLCFPHLHSLIAFWARS